MKNPSITEPYLQHDERSQVYQLFEKLFNMLSYQTAYSPNNEDPFF